MGPNDDDGFTRRWNGGVIHIDITYSNKKHFDIFGTADIKYVMHPTLTPMLEFKKMYTDAEDNDANRVLDNVHGFLLVAKVSGHLRVFDLQNLLQVLTTSIGLFALASKVVETLMVKCGPHKESYQLLMAQHS